MFQVGKLAELKRFRSTHFQTVIIWNTSSSPFITSRILDAASKAGLKVLTALFPLLKSSRTFIIRSIQKPYYWWLIRLNYVRCAVCPKMRDGKRSSQRKKYQRSPPISSTNQLSSQFDVKIGRLACAYYIILLNMDQALLEFLFTISPAQLQSIMFECVYRMC